MLGTSFEIDVSNPERTVIHVNGGKVLVHNQENTDSIVANKGDHVTYTLSEGFQKSKISSDLPIAAWRKPAWKFVSVSMDSILNELQRYYPVGIEVQDSNFLQCSATLSLRLTSFDSIIISLETLFDIKSTSSEPGQYLIKGSVVSRS